MPSDLYNIGRRGFLTQVSQGSANGVKIDWVNDTVMAQLITLDAAGFQFDPEHASLADIPNGARIGSPKTLANRGSTVDGWATADNVTFDAVTSPNGEAVSAVLLYRAGADDASSILVAYLDDVVSGLPIVPNGGDLTLLWNAGVDTRLFRL